MHSVLNLYSFFRNLEENFEFFKIGQDLSSFNLILPKYYFQIKRTIFQL